MTRGGVRPNNCTCPPEHTCCRATRLERLLPRAKRGRYGALLLRLAWRCCDCPVHGPTRPDPDGYHRQEGNTMPTYRVRKIETYYTGVEADNPERAQEEAEELPDYDWEQSDGPAYEVEGEIG